MRHRELNIECNKLLTQPTVFGSAHSTSDLQVLTSLTRKSRRKELDVIAMAREIKFKLCRVVRRHNRFVCNCVSIYDRCLYAMLEENAFTYNMWKRNSVFLTTVKTF